MGRSLELLEAIVPSFSAFTLLFLVFLPVERLIPGHRQEVLRKDWGTDVLFFFGQHVLWTAPVVAALIWISRQVSELPVTSLRGSVRELPYWLQFLLIILLCDVCIYWAHRLSHHNAFLWRFHRVHHTAEHLDWLAAYREHPFDNLYTRLVENLPAILLGFPLHTIAGFAMFRGLWALYIHSNIGLDPGPLRYVLGSPRLHHWHHEIASSDRVNFANVSPLMDLLFGTYYDPGHLPERYGIPQRVRRGYVAQLVDPLVPALLVRWVRRELPRSHREPSVFPAGSSDPQTRPSNRNT